MRITPGLGLLIAVVLILAFILFVPGYDDWLKELVTP